MVAISGDRCGNNRKTLTLICPGQILGPPMQSLAGLPGNVLANVPNGLCVKLKMAGNREICMGVRDERVRPKGVVLADVGFLQDITGQPLAGLHGRHRNVTFHATMTRLMRLMMASGTSPKKGSVP